MAIDPRSVSDIKDANLQVGSKFAWPRSVNLVEPNRNLLEFVNSPWVFDPVLNRRYREFVTSNFTTYNPGFHIQPKEGEKISTKQVEILRMFGVGSAKGYVFDNNQYYKFVGANLYKQINVISEAYFIPRNKISTAEKLYSSGQYGKYVDFLVSEGEPCAVSTPGPNDIKLELQGNKAREGIVIINRVFTSGWASKESKAKEFGGFWLAVDVSGSQNKILLSYWPPGLSYAIISVLIGFCMALTLPLYFKLKKIAS